MSNRRSAYNGKPKEPRVATKTKEESWTHAQESRKHKDWKSASAAYTAVLKSEPNHEDALMYRCFCYMRAGKLELADNDAFKLQQLVPERAIGYSLRGRHFCLLKQYGKASYEFQLALSLEPDLMIEKLKVWTDSIITYSLKEFNERKKDSEAGLNPSHKEFDSLRLLQNLLQQVKP